MSIPQYLILASNASTERFPDNTLTKFTNRLHSPIELPSRAHIALQSIIFGSLQDGTPPKTVHIDVDIVKPCATDGAVRKKTIATIDQEEVQALGIFDSDDSKPMHIYEAERAVYYPIEGPSRIRTASIKLLDDRGIQINLAPGEPTIATFELIFDMNRSGIIHIQSNESMRWFPDNHGADFTSVLNIPLSLKPTARVALSSIKYPARMVMPKLAGGYEEVHMMLVYCDIISPIHVGATQTNLLKIVPVYPLDYYRGRARHERVTYHPKHLDFITVSTGTIARIHTSIKSASGGIIKFENDGVVDITLAYEE